MTRRRFLRMSARALGAAGAAGLGGCGLFSRPVVPLHEQSDFDYPFGPPSRALFLSDLHFGAEPELDDFASDAYFTRFIREVVEPYGGRQDLVLLGDILDLWECETPGFLDREIDDVQLPRRSEPDSPIRAAVVEHEVASIDRIQARHPAFFSGLAEALASNEGLRLWFVEGNHDHTLQSPGGREALLAAIGDTAEDRVAFAWWYEQPDLGVYGEHGHQSLYPGPEGILAADLNCRLDDPFAESGMSAAYAFQRTFWSWAEPRLIRLDSFPSRWSGLVDWLLHEWSWDFFALAVRFAAAWLRGFRIGYPITFFDGRDTALLERCLTPIAEQRASVEGATPTDMEFVRRQLLTLRDELAAQAGARQVAGEERPTQLDVADAFFEADGYAMRGARLDRDVFHTVLMGHWHEAYVEPSPSGIRVANAGSWSNTAIRNPADELVDTTSRAYVVVDAAGVSLDEVR